HSGVRGEEVDHAGTAALNRGRPRRGRERAHRRTRRAHVRLVERLPDLREADRRDKADQHHHDDHLDCRETRALHARASVRGDYAITSRAIVPRSVSIDVTYYSMWWLAP